VTPLAISLVAPASSEAIVPAFFRASAMAASMRDSFFFRKSLKKKQGATIFLKKYEGVSDCSTSLDRRGFDDSLIF